MPVMKLRYSFLNLEMNAAFTPGVEILSLCIHMSAKLCSTPPTNSSLKPSF